MSERRPKLSRPMAIAGLLDAMMVDTPAGKRLREGRIWLAWERAVGHQIAAKAHPASFRDGTLTVSVASAPWMQQLTFLKQDIMAKLNAALGEDLVNELYFKAGTPQQFSHAADSNPKQRPRRHLTPAEESRIEGRIAAINDPELRQMFARIMRLDRETGTNDAD